MKTTTLTTAALLAICTGVTSLPARATDASALLQLAPICNGLYQGVLTTIRGPAGPNTNLKSMYTWQLNRCAVAGNTNAQAAGIIAPNGTLYAFTSELGAAIANDLTHLTSKSHVTFCPLIRRTEVLDNYINSNLNIVAQSELKQVHPDLLMRAAAFLLLKDSKASYAIEGETPTYNRAERWGKAIGQAGKYPLSHGEFLRLQEIVISDFRYTQPGYRIEGGFVGDHDRGTHHPIPDHISARFQDIYDLMEGLIETDNLLKTSNFNAVLAATVIAFGLVFIHPFEDGNGRIHRYLIHHALIEKGFTPVGVIFPVSYVILERLKEYRLVLESYSVPRLKLIKWRPTEKGNVEVLNETIDLYRYFDATKQAEFLFSCIQETIEQVLPNEIDYLQKYDEMKSFIENYIDMPDRVVSLLIKFLQQENGKFSKRAREKEFNSLTEDEINTIESKFQSIFDK